MSVLLTVLAGQCIGWAGKEVLKKAGTGCLNSFGNAILEKTRQGALPSNHHLDHALQLSLAKATVVLAYAIYEPNRERFGKLIEELRLLKVLGRVAEFIQGNITPGSAEEYWLHELIERATQSAFDDFSLDIVMTDNQFTALLNEQLNPTLSNHIHKSFLQWVAAHVTVAKCKPAHFDDYVIEGWTHCAGNQHITFYEVFCIFFREELKTNEVVFKAYMVATQAELKNGVDALLSQAPSEVERTRLNAALKQLGDFRIFQSKLTSLNEQIISGIGRIEAATGRLEESGGRIEATTGKTDATVGRIETGQTELQSTVLDGIQTIRKEIRSQGNRVEPDPDETIPTEIKMKLNEATRLANQGYYTDAKAKYEALLPVLSSYPLTAIGVKLNIASILGFRTPNTARPLFHECLEALKKTPSRSLQERALSSLGEMEAATGDLLKGKALLTEAQRVAASLDDRLCLASSLCALAGIADQEGNLDEAVGLYDRTAESFMAEYQQHNSATQEETTRGLGVCFKNKSLVQSKQGDDLAALSSLSHSVEWFRLSKAHDWLSSTLALLAQTEFALRKWDACEVHINEALQIAIGQENFCVASDYLDLAGQVQLTRDNVTGALQRFSEGLGLMRSHGKPQDVAHYAAKVARLYMKQGRKDEARTLLLEAHELGKRHGLLEHCAWVNLDLADIEDGPDSDTQRESATMAAIATLEQVLLQTQGKGRRALLMGRIGYLHQRLQQWDQALDWYNRSKGIFDEIGDVKKLAECYSSIADVRHAQERPLEEMEALHTVLTLVAGKHLPGMIASAKNGIGLHLMRSGDFSAAKQLFREAEDVCRQNHLPKELTDPVRANLEHVDRWFKAQNLAMDYAQIVRELHEWVAFFPEAKDSILRCWYFCREFELRAYCRTVIGLKWFVVEDDPDQFLALADHLCPYSDLILQVVNTSFPGMDIDKVPYPKDRALPERVAQARPPSYHLTPYEDRSAATGNTGRVIVGAARGLPPQAYRLMLNFTATIIASKKVFFLPFEAKDASLRLLDDLHFAKELSLVPMYTTRLPDLGGIEVMAKADMLIPTISPPVEPKVLRQISRKLVRLLSLAAQEMPAALSEVAGDLDDLRTDSHVTSFLRLKAYVLRFPLHGKQETHIAMVRLPEE